MKIIITNDDGVFSKGLKANFSALHPLGDIVACAPESQKTGTGRGFTLYKPIRVRKVNFKNFHAYATSGTPVDSLLYAIRGLEICPDLVVSGINLGENLSTEITASGTVGVALEAASYGYPSIAVSLEASKDMTKFEEGKGVDFGAAIYFTRKIVRKVIKKGLPPGVDLLNVNIPKEAKKTTDISLTFLERRMYKAQIEKRIDPMGRPYYWNLGDIIEKSIPGSDVDCIKNKKEVSITPLSIDMTAKNDFLRLNYLI
ncbi:MAG: 5'/3'-nucleotidase SurE [Candidatus Methanofastidiosia archaeon]